MSRRIYEALSDQLARARPPAKQREAYAQWAADCYRVGIALQHCAASFDVARFTDDCQREVRDVHTRPS